VRPQTLIENGHRVAPPTSVHHLPLEFREEAAPCPYRQADQPTKDGPNQSRILSDLRHAKQTLCR
jgi:hypothetical protein